MAFIFNGTQIDNCYLNGTKLDTVYMNGVQVYASAPPLDENGGVWYVGSKSYNSNYNTGGRGSDGDVAVLTGASSYTTADVIQLESGSAMSLLINEAGELWQGNSTGGWTLVDAGPYKKVSQGDNRAALVLGTDGTLYWYGNNGNKIEPKLDFGDSCSVPTPLIDLQGVTIVDMTTQVGGGYGGCLAVDANGDYWLWRDVPYKGDGSSTDTWGQCTHFSGNGYDKITTGYNTWFVRRASDKQWYGCGDNSLGQIGDGTTNNNGVLSTNAAGNIKCDILVCSQNSGAYVDSSGQVQVWGYYRYTSILSPELKSNLTYPPVYIASRNYNKYVFIDSAGNAGGGAVYKSTSYCGGPYVEGGTEVSANEFIVLDDTHNYSAIAINDRTGMAARKA